MFIEFCNSMTDFSLCGRATKKEYQNFLLIWLIISLLFFICCVTFYVITFSIKIDFENFEFIKEESMSLTPFICLVVFSSFATFFEIWSGIIFSVLTVKRLHDLNVSGLYFWGITALMILLCVSTGTILAGFLTYIILACVSFLSFADSYPFANKYDMINRKNGKLFRRLPNGKISIS